MTGVVWDDPAAEVGVPSAALAVYDEQYAAFSEAKAGADGAFSVPVPAGESFFLYASADGYTSTGWAAQAGLVDFSGGTDAPWLASASWMSDLREEWAACPGAEVAGTPGGGGVVIGELRLGYAHVPDGVEGVGATAALLDAAGNEIAACYHDETGVGSATAVSAGADGAFAIFGAPGGVSWLEARFTDDAGNDWATDYLSPMPEDGLVPMTSVLVAIDDG